MPIHSFESESGETIDVYVPASAPADEHHQQTKDGKVYKRVYTAPLAATNLSTRLGDATAEDFRRVTTDKKNLKLGEMWEASAEMSAKRQQRFGQDPVKEAGYAKYEKENGEKHPDVVRRERVAATNARLKEWGVEVKF